MVAQNDRERLLSILRAHGQQFLSAFDVPATPKHQVDESDGSDLEEEWAGFGSPANATTSETASDSERDGGFEQEDDDFAASSSRTPDVTVFQDSIRRQPDVSLSAKEFKKSFMSSKVCNVTLASESMRLVSKRKISDGGSDDERTNTQNDAVLHRLVHTKLLSGSLDPELNLDHAQRGRALAGRVLELAGQAKFGKGENVFRQEQRNKAAQRTRRGLIRKQREREQIALEEAKNLGNYHPTLKRLYDSGPSSTSRKRRARGLRMGVGNFVGGTLRLSREEIASVTGSRKPSQDGGRREIHQ